MILMQNNFNNYSINDFNELKNNLNKFLNSYSSLVILGIGNDIRGDDGLGPYIIENLRDLFESNESNTLNEKLDTDANLNENINNLNIHFINAGSVPENFTGEIRKINPSHIIMIDAVLMNESYGKIKFINKDEIVNVSVSTHSMSLTYLIKYLEQDNEYEILFIGVQPEVMDLSFELSPIIKENADKLVNIIFSLF